MRAGRSDEKIRAVSAGEGVVFGSPRDRVVARATIEQVAPAVAQDHVVTDAALDVVLAGPAVDGVVAFGAEQRAGQRDARADGDRVVPAPAVDVDAGGDFGD